VLVPASISRPRELLLLLLLVSPGVPPRPASCLAPWASRTSTQDTAPHQDAWWSAVAPAGQMRHQHRVCVPHGGRGRGGGVRFWAVAALLRVSHAVHGLGFTTECCTTC
jgi:hypothetical protein